MVHDEQVPAPECCQRQGVMTLAGVNPKAGVDELNSTRSGRSFAEAQGDERYVVLGGPCTKRGECGAHIFDKLARCCGG
jgi:hypothetical protein